MSEQTPSAETRIGTPVGERILSKTQAEKEKKKRRKARVAVEHVDVIKDGFWAERPWILGGRSGRRPVDGG